MSVLLEYLDTAKKFLLKEANFLNLEDGLAPALYIIVGGCLGVLIAFFIGLIVKGTSRAKKTRKLIKDTIMYVDSLGYIDEENVAGVNDRIQNMPPAAAKGWGHFLEQQIGYPSDYISKQETLGNHKGNPNYYAGTGVYMFLSLITVLICWAIAAIGNSDILANSANLDKSIVTMQYFLPILGALVAPLLLFLILSAVLNLLQRKSFKKLEKLFEEFQDVLDANVIIFKDAEDEFIEENIEEINAAIEDILANKLGKNNILEITTTPEYEIDLPIEEMGEIPLVKEEPYKEQELIDDSWRKKEEEAKEETAEEREIRLGERLVKLVFISDAASKDKDMTEKSLLDFRNYILEVKNGGDYPSKEAQEIFDSCLTILNGAHEARFRLKNKEVKEERRRSRLTQLVHLANEITKDAAVTEREFVEVQSIIRDAKASGEYNAVEEQEIFQLCLDILSKAYKKKF